MRRYAADAGAFHVTPSRVRSMQIPFHTHPPPVPYSRLDTPAMCTPWTEPNKSLTFLPICRAHGASTFDTNWQPCWAACLSVSSPTTTSGMCVHGSAHGSRFSVSAIVVLSSACNGVLPRARMCLCGLVPSLLDPEHASSKMFHRTWGLDGWRAAHRLGFRV